MRTIKFRVWDNELKKYRSEKDGDYSLGVLSGKVRGIYGEKFPQMEVQQFTGLHDKTGKGIFEGDILNFGNNNPVEVKFENGAFTVFSEPLGWDFESDEIPVLTDFKYCEVVGNIFENPDLKNKRK